MTDTVRQCPVDGCTNTHHVDRLMCVAHWRALPKPLRDDLWFAYRVDGIVSDEYMAAREACVAHAEGRDPKPVTT